MGNLKKKNTCEENDAYFYEVLRLSSYFMAFYINIPFSPPEIKPIF